MSDPHFQSAASRPAAVAGSWYPEDSRALARSVASMLQAAPPWPQGRRPRALVVPHAGLRYSGPTAASAYAALSSFALRRVVVLAPNHRAAVWGAAVDPSSHYESPLGSMPVDLGAVEQLAEQPHVTCSARPFAAEHAIEMQLPFLQHLLPQATLVPVLIGEMRDEEDYAALGAAIAPLLDAATLLVVSTDFMHYGDAFGYVPFTERVPEQIRDYDDRAIDALRHGSFAEFQDFLGRTGSTICGRRPLGVLLHLQPAAWKCELRSYTTSGEITGDWSHTVSYAALAYYEDEATAVAPGLSAADRRALLDLARRSMAHATGAGERVEMESEKWSAALRQPLAAFVTLHRREDGKLRGCIGWLEPHAALAEAVIENAAAAATRDPRFDPVSADEVEAIEIEISVLGPMTDVDDVQEIRMGRDGLLIEREGLRGILLPQVAVHMGWNRVQFLEGVCRKAGLAPDSWRRGAVIRRFEAEIFSESQV